MGTANSEGRHELFIKYADILEGYEPEPEGKKLAGAVYKILFLLFLAVLLCAGYIYLFPERVFIKWDNQAIIDGIEDIVNSIAEMFKRIFKS